MGKIAFRLAATAERLSTRIATMDVPLFNGLA